MSTPTIIVTGDVVADHHVYVGQRPAPDASAEAGTRLREELGGAAVLYRMVQELFRGEAIGEQVAAGVHFGLDVDSLRPFPESRRRYTLWTACPDDGGGKPVWRMTTPLGYGGGAEQTDPSPGVLAAGLPATPDVVTIDDSALGFRFWPARDRWPIDVAAERALPNWIVLRMAAPAGQGDLWRQLSTCCADRLVVIVAADDLRRERVRISRGISWERTTEDLVDELDRNPTARRLLSCRHLIVRFGNEGALWVSRGDPGMSSTTLVFDPELVEGEWGLGIGGAVVDPHSCMTAAITRELALSGQLTTQSLARGLAAMRRLRQCGHGLVSSDAPGYPFAEVADAIAGRGGRASRLATFSVAHVPDVAARDRGRGPDWMMPGSDSAGGSDPRPLFGEATRIARFGVRAIDNIPIGRFGKLVTVDRHEIESLRSIRRLMEDYAGGYRGGKPLSLAVFGPPGAGKSFGIKQLAAGVLGPAVPILEFNLSQFRGPEDLVGAWHEVRDHVLQGATPVVFWDEFDAREYEWLQYFLAPMQDGKFQEGRSTHTVGKSVFVFAGATSSTLEAFGPPPSDEAGQRAFRLRKGPDFVSRLGGHLAVLGPNPRQTVDAAGNDSGDDVRDVCFPVRRALLLRALLGLGPTEVLDVDPGLLDALLGIDRFRYGARSMEMIASHLKRHGGRRFRPSHLPPTEVMAMHVSVNRFMRICDSARRFQTKASDLAPAIHETWRRLGRERGWSMQYDVDYEALPEDVKADNIAAASRIPEILGLVGLQVSAKTPGAADDRSRVHAVLEEHLEVLAAAEHDGWMTHKLRNGWRQGKVRDDEQRLHTALVPYADLAEPDREKDRDSVRHFPDIVELAGFTIVSRSGVGELES